jgi:chemotaxis protein methyltransferase CheR
MRWEGFRKVRSQVCKRIDRRMSELGLEDHTGYRRYLELHDGEWTQLDRMCRVTISRFYRDRGVFEMLGNEVLPELASVARGSERNVVTAWSCGCASGEEAYSLAVLWHGRVAEGFPETVLKIEATDSDPRVLERAREGNYTEGSIRELPVDLRQTAFEGEEEPYRIREDLCESMIWRCQDVRKETPPGPFDLLLCRNLVLTYFDKALQREVMEGVMAALRPGGALVIGSHERLPLLSVELEPWSASLPIYRRIA